MAQKLNLYRGFIKDTVPSTLLVLGQQRYLGAMLPGDKAEDIPWMKPLFGSGVDYDNEDFKESNEESPINFTIDPDNPVLGDEGVDDYHQCCSVRFKKKKDLNNFLALYGFGLYINGYHLNLVSLENFLLSGKEPLAKSTKSEVIFDAYSNLATIAGRTVLFFKLFFFANSPGESVHLVSLHHGAYRITVLPRALKKDFQYSLTQSDMMSINR